VGNCGAARFVSDPMPATLPAMPRETTNGKFAKGDIIAEEFEVIKKLGEGGCGSVYRCRWVKNPDREVALKLLDNPSDTQRFIREARVLRKTKHTNVLRLLGSGYHSERPFLVLELIDGGSLRDLLESKGKLGLEESAWIIIQSIRGLRASKTVHRDLKPENLLISKGSKGRGLGLIVGDVDQGAVIKVADFGLAKQAETNNTRLTNSGQVMGTPVYMSPEQCRNTKNVSVRSDIYSLGVLLYEMIFGRPPFDANNAYDIMTMHCKEEPKIPRTDSRMKAIIEKCLQKTPGKRYGSLIALERELNHVAGLGEPEPEGSPLRTFVIMLIGVAILVGILYVFRDRLPIIGELFNAIGW
jgi:eukaryotic-like serine/threonine-protein kinase